MQLTTLSCHPAALFLALPHVIPLNTRIIVGHGLLIVIFGIAATMALLTLDPYAYFLMTLGLIVLSALATSFLAALYGIVSTRRFGCVCLTLCRVVPLLTHDFGA